MSNKYETLLYINIYDNGRLRWWSNDAMGLYDKDLMNSHQGPVGAVRSQSQNSEIWGKYIYVKWMYTVNIWTVNMYIYICLWCTCTIHIIVCIFIYYIYTYIHVESPPKYTKLHRYYVQLFCVYIYIYNSVSTLQKSDASPNLMGPNLINPRPRRDFGSWSMMICTSEGAKFPSNPSWMCIVVGK